MRNVYVNGLAGFISECALPLTHTQWLFGIVVGLVVVVVGVGRRHPAMAMAGVMLQRHSAPYGTQSTDATYTLTMDVDRSVAFKLKNFSNSPPFRMWIEVLGHGGWRTE